MIDQESHLDSGLLTRAEFTRTIEDFRDGITMDLELARQRSTPNLIKELQEEVLALWQSVRAMRKEFLGDLSLDDAEVRASFKSVSPNQLIDALCSRFDVPRKGLISKVRTDRLVNVRWMAFYYLTEYFGLSLTEVGEIFDGRHHTTVMHGVAQFKARGRMLTIPWRVMQGWLKSKEEEF